MDADELEQLRRRLDAPGGGRLSLSPREHAAYYDQMRIIRTPAAVQDMIRTVNAEAVDSDANGQEYARGILDGIAWACGRRAEAPVTGDVAAAAEPSMAELRAEMTAAIEALRGQRDTIRPREYVTGVEAALAWLTAAVDDPPW